MNFRELEVRILGQDFHFNIPESIDTNEFLEIINYVENKIHRIKREIVDLDSFKLGLLASINIAEEYFSLKKENEKLKNILNKIDAMIPVINPEKSQLPISFSS
jgi:cell division protein ZapA (FtsZ GTPase activity inhibitor)